MKRWTSRRGPLSSDRTPDQRAALALLVVLFVAVLHGDALHPSFPHRGRGFFQRQPAPHRLVHLAVQGGVQNPLQAEVAVLFLLHGSTKAKTDTKFQQQRQTFSHFNISVFLAENEL